MHVEAAAGDADGIIHRKPVTIGIVDGDADAARIHNHRAFLGQDSVGADRRRVFRSTHRCRHHPIFAEVHSVVRRRQRRRRSLLDSVDTHGERVLGDAGNPDDGGTRLEIARQAAHRKLHRAVRRPEAVGNPLHNVVVEPFELAGHRGRRFDFNGALGRVPIGWVSYRRTERHHHGVRHAHHLAARW